MRCVVVVVLSAWLAAGCGGPEPAGDADQGPSPAVADPGPRETARSSRPAPGVGSGGRAESDRATSQSPVASGVEEDEEEAPLEEVPAGPGARSLSDLLDGPEAAGKRRPALVRLEVDEARAAAEGIRKVSGERLTLYTDLAPAEEVDELPGVFAQAFPQWCAYFDVDPADHADWSITGFLMNDREAFLRAGLLPDELPAFAHGFSRSYELWLYEQPSAYYRRHLLLHEGTHSFMNTVLGGCGPPWYMEGTAELLGTHRWQEGRLTLAHMPTSREEVPMWGRIKIVKDAYAAEQAMRLPDVIKYPPTAHRETGPYAWCWAAAALLDGHPRYQDRFRQLRRLVREPDFSDRFQRLMGDDWDGLTAEWQVFVANLEYGHDVARMAIDFTPGRPLAEGGASVRVAADRGWQNSGLRLESGVTYRIGASGRYQVADEPQIWWCEPGGVSIRYYQGRPLGMLLAAVRGEASDAAGLSPLVRPIAVGLGATLTPAESGTLFLRINDSAAELGDNAGELTVRLMAASGP